MSAGTDASLTAKISLQTEGEEIIKRLEEEFKKNLIAVKNLGKELANLKEHYNKLSSSTGDAMSNMGKLESSISKVVSSSSSLGNNFKILEAETARLGSSSLTTANLVKGLDSTIAQTKTTVGQLAGAFATSVQAYSTAAISVWGLYNAYDNLEKVQLQVERSELALQKAHTRLAALQENYNEGIRTGRLSEEEAVVQKQKLADATEAVTLAQEKARLAQEDYTELMTGFATQVIPFAVIAGTSLAQMYTTLRTTTVSAAGGTTLLSVATTRLSEAFKFLFVSNPWLLAIAAALALVTSYSTNLFGFADAINSIGEAIGTIHPALQWLMDGLGQVGNFLRGITGDAKDVSKALEKEFGSANVSISADVETLGKKYTDFQLNSDLIMEQAKKKIVDLANVKLKEEEFIIPISINEGQFIAEVEKIEKIMKERTGKEADIASFGLFPDAAKLKMYVEGPEGLIGILEKARTNAVSIIQSIFESIGSGSTKPLVDKFDIDKMVKDFDSLKGKIGDNMKYFEVQVSSVSNKVQILRGNLDKVFEGLTEEEAKKALETIIKLYALQGKELEVIESKQVSYGGKVALTTDYENLLQESFRETFKEQIHFIDGVTNKMGVYSNILSQIINKFPDEGITKGVADTLIADLQAEVALAKSLSDQWLEHFTDVISTQGDLESFSSSQALKMADVVSLLDVSDKKYEDSINTLSRYIASGEIGADQALKIASQMKNGVIEITSGMDEVTVTAVENINKILKRAKSMSKEELALLVADIYNIINKGIGKADFGIAMKDFNVTLKETGDLSKEVLEQGSKDWEKYGALIKSAASVSDLDIIIEALEKQRDLTTDPAKRKSLEAEIDIAKTHREILLNSTDIERIFAEQVIKSAVSVGYRSEALSELIAKQKTGMDITKEDITAIQTELIERERLGGILNDQIRLGYELGAAKYETLKTVNDTIAAIDRETELNELQIDQWERQTGIELPEWLDKTAESYILVYKAQKGNIEAQKQLNKLELDYKASLDPIIKKQMDFKNQVEKLADQLGIATVAMRNFRKEKELYGMATKDTTNLVIKDTQANINAKGPLDALTLSQEELNFARLQGRGIGIQSMKDLAVATQQEIGQLYQLIKAVQALGFNMAQIYKMGSIQNITEVLKGYVLGGVEGAKDIFKSITKSSGGGGGGGGGGGSQKQEIDKKALREQAAQAAVEERAAIDHLVQKLIDERNATHDLALEMGVGIREMKKYEKATDEFGIATEEATIRLLELTAAEARNMRFLTNSNEQLKDRYRALIEGATAANDFTREIRMSVIAEKEEEEQLLRLTKALGISLPDSLEASVENLQDLIAAAYGSEEAMKNLTDKMMENATAIGDYYREVIEDAKQAITDANFEEFVKKELLFAGVGDEFFRNITREIQSEMKLDQIAEQMRKQLGLIKLNPETFKMGVPKEDLQSGVYSTIAAIEEAVSGNERLATAWQPIVDALKNTISSPDIHTAIQDFADSFPNILEPALTGVDFALQGLDTQINTTFADTKNEQIEAQRETVDDLKNSYDDIYDELLDAAKAAQEASDSMSGAADSANDMADAWVDNVNKAMEYGKASEESLGGVSTGVQGALDSLVKLGPSVQDQTGIMDAAFGSIPVSVLQYFGTDIPQAVKEGLDQVQTSADLNVMMMKLGYKDFYDDTAVNFKTHMPANVDEGLSKLPPSVATTVSDMDVKMYEFNLNLQRIWNPAIARSVKIGMDMLPPIVQATMTQLTGIFTKGGSDWEAAVKTVVDKMNKMFESMVATVKKVVSDINSELSKLEDVERKIIYTYETRGTKPSSAQGGAFVVGRETHLTVGEGNRPELVSVMPLSSDYFRNNGLADGSLGLFSSDKERTLTSDIGRSGGAMLSYSPPQSVSSRPIIINNIIPVSIGNEEVKKVITSETFDGYDEQL